MPLQYVPHPIGNSFEGAVVRELGRVELDGFLAHNILLPNVRHRYNPNEHDVIVLLHSFAITLDAKEYRPGYYRIPLNGSMEFRKDAPSFDSFDGNTTVLPHVPNPFHVAYQKACIVHSLLERIDASLKRYPILSWIVVPDSAELSPYSHRWGSSDDMVFDLRAIKLRELVHELLKAHATVSSTTWTRPLLRQVFEFLEALPRTVSQGLTIAGVHLQERIERREPGCPVDVCAYVGKHQLSGISVEARIYRKWPWNRATERFIDHVRRRLQAIMRISDPHVMRLLAAEDLPDIVMLAFVQFEGETLRELVKRRGVLSPHLVTSIVRHISTTIHCLHQCGVIHLDIRPEHILVGANIDTHGGERHLVTGLTNPLICSEVLSTQTFSDSFEGSFAAPEMQYHRHPERGKPTCDVFSLGRLAIYCLLGERRYRELLVEENLYVDGAERRLGAVLRRATEGRPALRYQTLRELIDALN